MASVTKHRQSMTKKPPREFSPFCTLPPFFDHLYLLQSLCRMLQYLFIFIRIIETSLIKDFAIKIQFQMSSIELLLIIEINFFYLYNRDWFA